MPFLANRPDIAGFEFTFALPDAQKGFVPAESDFVKQLQALQLGSRSNGLKLPVEVLTIVCEHLIGGCAFGTAACLNVTSKSIHSATLPVLWETLFMERIERGHTWSERAKYTKLLVVSTNATEQAYQALPNLIMAIGNVSEGSGTLRMFKPISIESVKTILETRILHPTENHSQYQVVRYQVFGSTSDNHDARNCEPYKNRPRKRPIDRIHQVCFDGGYVYGTVKSATSSETSPQFRLQNTSIRYYGRVQHDRTNYRLSVTIIEFLKLAGISSKMTNAESAPIVTPGFICHYAQPIYPWQLHLNLPHDQVKALCKKLELEARSTPSILHNRIKIYLTDSTGSGRSGSLVEHMRRVYERLMASTKSVLPSYAYGPVIFSCKALYTADTSTSMADPTRRPRIEGWETSEL